MSALPIIVIRPEPGNAATLALAHTKGLDARGYPLFTAEPVAWDCPDSALFDGLLIGSANVFRLGGAELERLTGLPVHVVGHATAEAAKQAGFTVATTGEGGLQFVLDQLPGKRLLRLAGEEHLALTAPADTQIETRIVYRVRPLPLPDDLINLLANGAVVLLHSGEAARHFAALCDAAGLDRKAISLACLGERIAEAVGTGWQAAKIPPKRTDLALLALAEQMCQNVAPGGTG